MKSLFAKTVCRVLLISSPLLLFSATGAFAQDASMKVCGEKWQAAKAANATNGATWPKFLAECRAAGATPSPATSASAASAQAPASAPAPAKAAPPEAGKAPVFPVSVAAKFADLRPSQGRQKTCSEQYQANKATDANGGLRWLEKGGGYWSLCNKKLKGA